VTTDTGPMALPKAALAMIPGVEAQMLTPAARAELDGLVDLVALPGWAQR
jgi:hypothetical protein